MPHGTIPRVPQFGAKRTATERLVVLANGVFVPHGRIIDGALSRDPLNTGEVHLLRAGLLLGEITASGKYAPSIIGVTSGAEAGGSTLIEVSTAVATELVRRIGDSGTFNLVGPPTAGATVVTESVTYTAIDTTAGEITVAAITASFIGGSFISPDDGSGDFNSILGDGTGIRVLDEDLLDIDAPVNNLVVGGLVDQANIVNYPTDVALIAFVKSELRLRAPELRFDDDF